MWHIWQRAGMIVGCGILHLILEEFFRKLGGFFGCFFLAILADAFNWPKSQAVDS